MWFALYLFHPCHGSIANTTTTEVSRHTLCTLIWDYQGIDLVCRHLLIDLFGIPCLPGRSSLPSQGLKEIRAWSLSDTTSWTIQLVLATSPPLVTLGTSMTYVPLSLLNVGFLPSFSSIRSRILIAYITARLLGWIHCYPIPLPGH